MVLCIRRPTSIRSSYVLFLGQVGCLPSRLCIKSVPNSTKACSEVVLSMVLRTYFSHDIGMKATLSNIHSFCVFKVITIGNPDD